MQPAWLSYINWIDAPQTALTADREIGLLGVENLKRRQSASVWRTPQITSLAPGAGFVADFGQVRQIAAVALVTTRQNDPSVFDPVPGLASTDTVRHRFSAVSATGDELYDSGAVASGVDRDFGYHVLRLPAPVSARWWRVDISAPSRAAEGFLDIARAWAGPVLSPRISFSYGDQIGWQANTDAVRVRRGVAEYADAAEPAQAWSLTFDAVDDSEREAWDDFERRVTTGQQFLIWRPDRPAGRAAMLARQTAASAVESMTWRRSRKVLRLTESL